MSQEPVICELDEVLELELDDDVEFEVLVEELVDVVLIELATLVETGVETEDEDEVTTELVLLGEEVVTTLEAVVDLLVRTTYAPTPATAIITTKTIATTIGAIPLLG